MKAQDPLEEINQGEGEVKRPTYISAKVKPSMKKKVVVLLKEFKDFFAWDYNDMSGLSRNMMELKLLVRPGKKSVKQLSRRFAPEIMLNIKEEIERLLRSKFIRTNKRFLGISDGQKRHRDQSKQNESGLGSQASFDKETSSIFVGENKLPEKIHLQFKWQDSGFLAITST